MVQVESVLFAVLGVLCWAAFFYRLPHLRHDRRDRALIALLAAFAFKGTAFVLAVPAVADVVDRVLGVPDLGALGIHLFGGVGFGAAVLVALVYWAQTPEQAWRKARWRIAVAAVVLLTMLGLWVAARVGVQQRSAHYLVQNADRPVVVVYLLLYAGSLVVALGEIARMGRKYGNSAGDPWLRRGLRLTALGALIYSVNFLNRVWAIVAVRVGLHPLDWEGVTVLGAGIGVPLIIGGLTMPSWGPQLSAALTWRRNRRMFRALYPLWADLYRAFPSIALDPPSRSLRDLNYRLYRRIIEIRDAQLALRPYLDPAVAEEAESLGVQSGLTGDELRAHVEAAVLKAALATRAAGEDGHPDQVELRGGDDLTEDGVWLVRVARSYARLSGV